MGRAPRQGYGLQRQQETILGISSAPVMPQTAVVLPDDSEAIETTSFRVIAQRRQLRPKREILDPGRRLPG